MYRVTFVLAFLYMVSSREAAIAQTQPRRDQGNEEQPMGELTTERPGFTSSSGTVGLGVLQLEQGFGLQYQHSNGGTNTTFLGPSAMFRLGISANWEFRLISNGYSWESLRTGSVRDRLAGPNDFGVAVKGKIWKQHKATPEVSVTAGSSIPARGSSFTTSGYDPSATVAASKDLPAKLSLTANGNFASVTGPQGRYFSSGQSLWLARPLKIASAFGEVFHTTLGWREGSETAFDLGFYRCIGKHIQVDAEAGHTIGGREPGWFVSGGLALRYPHKVLPSGFWRAAN